MLAQDIPKEILGYAVSSSIGRKALFIGAMYFAGGLIITTVGLGPVLISGAILMAIWFFNYLLNN